MDVACKDRPERRTLPSISALVRKVHFLSSASGSKSLAADKTASNKTASASEDMAADSARLHRLSSGSYSKGVMHQRAANKVRSGVQHPI